MPKSVANHTNPGATTKSDRIITSLALTRADHARLKQIAAVQQRTVSGQVRYWNNPDDTTEAAA